MVGPDGRKTTRDTRKYFYTCGAEMGPRKKKLVQHTLPSSFTRDAKTFSDLKGNNAMVLCKGYWGWIAALQRGKEVRGV